MRRSRKPVHQCYQCLLNLGDHCWVYDYPRGQWSGHKRCPGFENEEVYAAFRLWRKQPTVKSRRELRREFFRGRRRRRLPGDRPRGR